MLSEKELNKMGTEIKQLVEFCGKLDNQLGELPSNVDNWSIKLTYLNANRLLQHSKRLTLYTILLLVATILLFGTAIANLVITICRAG